MKKFIFIFFLFCQVSSYGKELQVGLKTQENYIPLCFQFIENKHSRLSQSYQEQIRDLFIFDLNQSGYLNVSQEKHPIKVQIRFDKNYLYTTLIHSTYEKKKNLKTIHLSGNLPHDRMHIHKLSDIILKQITGKTGIATTKILYSLKRRNQKSEWISEIWQCDYDGENKRKVASSSSYCVSPCYIPVSSYLGYQCFLYVCYRTGQPKIYSASFANPRGTPLLNIRGNQLLPSISKQGDKVAFICDATGRADLFIQNFDIGGNPVGKPTQIFSLPNATQASSTFSPDGRQIAFVSDKEGVPGIYLADIPTVEAKTNIKTILLTKKNRHNSSPAWSPDGSKLAYSAKVNGTRQIWIYDFKKQKEWQLTDTPEHKENPSWAPNGLHLIYNSEGADTAELYMINLKQKKPHIITHGFGLKRFPCWEPKKIKKEKI